MVAQLLRPGRLHVRPEAEGTGAHVSWGVFRRVWLRHVKVVLVVRSWCLLLMFVDVDVDDGAVGRGAMEGRNGDGA